jgi:hypothetical protein
MRSRARALLLVVLLVAVAARAASGGGAPAQAHVVARAQAVAHPHAVAVAQAVKDECGTAGPETLAETVGAVAAQIYSGEVASSETFKDRLQVETYAPLLEAVARNDKGAVRAAVTSLVYSHTHIVRLRVSRGSTLLADVGGPYILAPLSGELRLHGRVVGHYVLSVQDDVGYVKIEHRFIGDPLVLRAGPQNLPVEGLMEPGPGTVPEHGPVHYEGAIFQAYSFKANTFPSGPLRISILVPLPGGLAEESCTTIRNTELRDVTRRVAGQLSLGPDNFQVYTDLVRTLTDGLFYVRVGARQLAGTTTPGPSRLPVSGSVRYHGVSYEVSSFTAPSSVGTVRIYELLPE